MPDHQWKCGKCGEKNPAFTEVCRNCQSSVIACDELPSKAKNSSAIPQPFFDTSIIKSFKYQSLEEVSQEKFEIVSEIKPIRWLIFPVFFVLALLMVNSAIETFQTGQTYAKGGRLLTGQVAYLKTAFGSYAILSLPFMVFRGPKWFSIFKRSLMVGLFIIFIWSLTAQVSMAAI
jgi:hypothetical protein